MYKRDVFRGKEWETGSAGSAAITVTPDDWPAPKVYPSIAEPSVPSRERQPLCSA